MKRYDLLFVVIVALIMALTAAMILYKITHASDQGTLIAQVLILGKPASNIEFTLDNGDAPSIPAGVIGGETNADGFISIGLPVGPWLVMVGCATVLVEVDQVAGDPVAIDATCYLYVPVLHSATPRLAVVEAR